MPKVRRRRRDPDGVYEVIGQAINVLTSSSYSSAQLERIADVVRESCQSRTEPSAVADALEREAPELAGVVRRLLIPRSAADFYAILAVLLIAIQLMLPA